MPNRFPINQLVTVLVFCSALLIPSPARAQQSADALPYLTEQPVRARHGMVVSVHHLASDAGVAILREGGNAVDAAVATGFALAVVHPAAGNLGGGGFMLLRTHDGKSTFIDYREQAPLAATQDMYLDAQGNVIPDASVLGVSIDCHAGIGCRPGLCRKEIRPLGLKKVMAPAIALARDGFVLTEEEARQLADPDLAKFADSKRIFQRDGNLLKAGETFKQPELAKTLERISNDPGGFYHGKMAEELVAELKAGGALLTARRPGPIHRS
jgi:gamma-glutamyltranspeptidase / glutathione hydrolase